MKSGPASHMSISGEVRSVVEFQDFEELVIRLRNLEEKVEDLEEKLKKKRTRADEGTKTTEDL